MFERTRRLSCWGSSGIDFRLILVSETTMKNASSQKAEEEAR